MAVNTSAIVVRQSSRSLLRAWFALIGLSLRRQMRARLMIIVALALLFIAVAMVALQTMQNGWTVSRSRYSYPAAKSNMAFPPMAALKMKGPGNNQPRTTVTYGLVGEQLLAIADLGPYDPAAQAAYAAANGGYQAALVSSGVVRFTRAMLFSLFLGFLLPVWCLSFATEALGGEVESKSLVWLLTRPMPRWSIFIAKYVALMPWALAFTLGGFGLMCLVGGQPGRMAYALYWPAVGMGTLAFTSVFHMFAALTRRPTVVGLVYCFFLETLLGDMPGLMKRVSVSYYVRCMIFEEAAGLGIQPEKPSVYLPVAGSTAMAVLAGVTTVALLLGAILFTRAEYRDDAS